MQSSTEENSNISSSKGRKDNSQKIFFSCFKTILHRNQKGNALECKQATKLDLTVCTLLYLAQECVQLSQQKKNMFSKKKS